MKFYVASSFKNIELVRKVSEMLKSRGFLQTYDWTKHNRASIFEKLKDIGMKEKEAVQKADFIVVVLPAGKGSHIELGIAIGLQKKIFLYSPNEEVKNLETTSTFYFLPEVKKCYGTVSDLIATITNENQKRNP